MSLLRGVRGIASRLPGYLTFLLSSGYAADIGWYSRLGDARVGRASFFDGKSVNCYASSEGARIPLEGMDDLDATFDVYHSGHYDRLNGGAKLGSVVWDIGANLGVASLIFAQNPNITHVYAYEPMAHTFSCTQRTLASNSALAAKITLENMGIGGSERDLEISYTEKAKAAIGLSGIPDRLVTLYNIKPEDMKVIAIHVADADHVLRFIRSRHPAAPILLKLDAEGAEYEIVDRLAETGALKEIAAAAIEWHLSPGESNLTSHLHAAGFKTFAKVLEADGSIGMIDAWR